MSQVYRRDSRGRKGQTITAFALGAALGGIAALLFAPASGAVTRKRLLLKAKNVRRTMGRKIQLAQRVVTDRAVEARDAATEWITDHVSNGHGRRPMRRHALRHA